MSAAHRPLSPSVSKRKAPPTQRPLLALSAEQSFASVAERHREFGEALSRDPRLLVDLSQVSYIDAAFLQLCLHWHTRARAENRSFQLVNVSEALRVCAQSVGLLPLLEQLVSQEQEALDA